MAIQEGMTRRGDRSPRCCSAETVEEIRRLVVDGMDMQTVAARVGVHKATVARYAGHLVRRKRGPVPCREITRLFIRWRRHAEA